jgi:hypothetical protein
VRFNGSHTLLSKACGKSLSQLGQVLRPPAEDEITRKYRIGEKLAREMESRMQLDPHSLDGGIPNYGPQTLAPEVEAFLGAMRTAMSIRNVPIHMLTTILQILESAPLREK